MRRFACHLIAVTSGLTFTLYNTGAHVSTVVNILLLYIFIVKDTQIYLAAIQPAVEEINFGNLRKSLSLYIK